MKSFPWNSIVDGIDPDSGFPVYDRPYDAEDFRNVMQRFFSDGIFSDEPLGFGVTAGEGMTVQVESGSCLIQGTTGIETETRTLMIQAADRDNPRIDTVVLRWDSDIEERSIDLYVLEGTPAKEPVRPELTRLKGTVWELGLCDILIPAESTSILNVHMTDTRLDYERCGIVTPFAKFDSTTFYNTIRAKIAEMSEELQKQTDTAVELAKSALDGTTAGHLQNQIDDINDLTTGINLLRGTKNSILGTEIRTYLNGRSINKDGFDYKSSYWTTGKDESGYTYLAGKADRYSSNSLCYSSAIELDNNGKYTVSFDLKLNEELYSPDNEFDTPASVEIWAYTYSIDSGSSALGEPIDQNIIQLNANDLDELNFKYGEWNHISIPVDFSHGNIAVLQINSFVYNFNTPIYYRKFKVEKGNINNPIWSESPFDVKQIKDGGTGADTALKARENLGIQSGITEINVSTQYVSTTPLINFPKAFNNTPSVVITPIASADQSVYNNMNIRIHSVSNKNFSVRAYINTASTVNPIKINWTAMEPTE